MATAAFNQSSQRKKDLTSLVNPIGLVLTTSKLAFTVLLEFREKSRKNMACCVCLWAVFGLPDIVVKRAAGYFLLGGFSLSFLPLCF